MKEQSTVAWRQPVPVLAVAAAFGVLGSAALPLIFNGQPGATGIWLVVAILIAVCVLALMPALTRPVAASLSSLTELVVSPTAPGRTITPGQIRMLARLLVFIAEVLIAQAVLRKPLAAVLGGDRQSAPVEAAVAAGALTILLGLLTWTYQTARPMVQAAALRALDAAIPTVGSVVRVESPTTTSPAAVPPTARPPVAARAAANGGDATTVTGAATLAAGGGATLAAGGDATLAAGDATIASPHRASVPAMSPPDGDETVVTPQPDADRTIVTRRHADDTLKDGR
jgi:hypothetical protein